LYYLKEISPPRGYSLNNKRYYFFFTSSSNENKISDTKQKLSDDYGVAIDDIYVMQSGVNSNNEITVTDEKTFTLPKTGGIGTVGLTVTGVIFIMGSLCLIYIRFVAKKRR
jgi:LPXTG-motif cell wall-anchored protein